MKSENRRVFNVDNTKQPGFDRNRRDIPNIFNGEKFFIKYPGYCLCESNMVENKHENHRCRSNDGSRRHPL